MTSQMANITNAGRLDGSFILQERVTYIIVLCFLIQKGQFSI